MPCWNASPAIGLHFSIRFAPATRSYAATLRHCSPVKSKRRTSCSPVPMGSRDLQHSRLPPRPGLKT